MDFGFLMMGLHQVSFLSAEGPSKTLSRFRVPQKGWRILFSEVVSLTST